MEESLKFYRDIVGLSLSHRFTDGKGSEFVFLGDGETKLELIGHEAQKYVDLGKDISLGFTVNSVDEKLAFIRGKGIAVHSGPFQPGPHVKFFFVLDPNGLKIQFVENIT
jgi:lactoylglutathione lyase